MIQRIHDSGEVAKTYRYDAFGNEETPEPLDANPFRYCGEYFDAETATLYLRARSYDARSGRFTQEDSVREMVGELVNGQELANPLGYNLYTYCINNPVLLSDPSGMKAKEQTTKKPPIGDRFDAWWNSQPEYVKDGTKVPSTEELLEEFLGYVAQYAGDGIGTIAGMLAKDAGTSVASDILSAFKKQINVAVSFGRGEYPKDWVKRTIPKFAKSTKVLSRLSSILLYATTVLDVANTWTEDNGNTIGQRVVKTGIQVAGVVLSYAAGVLASAVGALVGVKVPKPIVILGVKLAVGMGLGFAIDTGMNQAYKSLNIK